MLQLALSIVFVMVCGLELEETAAAELHTVANGNGYSLLDELKKCSDPPVLEYGTYEAPDPEIEKALLDDYRRCGFTTSGCGPRENDAMPSQ